MIKEIISSSSPALRKAFLWNQFARSAFVSGSALFLLVAAAAAEFAADRSDLSITGLQLLCGTGIALLYVIYCIAEWFWQKQLNFPLPARIINCIPVAGWLAKPFIYPRSRLYMLFMRLLFPVAGIAAAAGVLPMLRVSPFIATLGCAFGWDYSAWELDFSMLPRSDWKKFLLSAAIPMLSLLVVIIIALLPNTPRDPILPMADDIRAKLQIAE